MPEMQKRAAPTTCCAPVHKKCRQHSSVLEFESGAGEEKSDSFDSHDEHSKIAVSISNYQWKDSPPVPRRTSSRACTIKIKPLDLSCSPDSPTVLNASTLGTDAAILTSCILPHGENEVFWISSHLRHFFREVKLVYGTVASCCTHESCPVMNAGQRFEYRWFNGTSAVTLSAPVYVRTLFTWVESLLKCSSLFPTEPGVPFRPDFLAHCRIVFKRLFRVYAHLYYSHVDNMCQLKVLTHVNTSLKHFISFAFCFNLLSDYDIEPLMPVLTTLMRKSSSKSSVTYR